MGGDVGGEMGEIWGETWEDERLCGELRTPELRIPRGGECGTVQESSQRRGSARGRGHSECS